MLNAVITNTVPRSDTDTNSGAYLYWNTDQMEVMQRLRLKMYYDYLLRKDQSCVMDASQEDITNTDESFSSHYIVSS